MADTASAESELLYLNNLNRTSEELVQSLEGVLAKLKTLNEGAAAGAKVMSEWDNVLQIMNSPNAPAGFVAVPAASQ